MEHSDLVLDASKFRLEAIPQTVKKSNDGIRKLTVNSPKWWEVGVEKSREMRVNGEAPFPKPVMLDGTPFEIPSRDSGRKIPCRIMKPDNGQYKAVIMHIHGGGWVLMTESAYDPTLKAYANGASALVISVGYRLAPEHPFPAGPDDCRDVVDWLADNAEKELGAPFQFITGDSAGGHLTMISYLHISKTHPSFPIRGLVSVYGCFDLTKTPSCYQLNDDLILTPETYNHFREATVPGLSLEQLKEPSISPLYANLQGLKLPPHFLVCGTADMLMDDTAFMATKWIMAGGEASVKWYPGAPHGFLSLPKDDMPPAGEAMNDILGFFNAKVKG